MSNPPLLSVILPVYNNGPELQRAVNSVVEQAPIAEGRLRLEIIVVDDGSEPSTQQRLQQLAEQQPCFQLLRQDNAGPAAARNLGLKHAQGEYISFIDGDDQWCPDKLALLLPELDRPGITVAAGKISYRSENGHSLPAMLYETADHQITHVHLGTLLAKREVFDSGQLFDESLRFSEDINWWYQLREQQHGIVIIEQPTLYYYVHGSNMSVGKDAEQLKLTTVLRKTLARRRHATGQGAQRPIPQLNDFRRYQQPLVSIVMPLYNGEAFITRALDSVAAQSYPHYEVLIVNDGSTDRGAELALQHPLQPRVINQPNNRQAAARNTGISHAKGKYIAFLDQDDQWLPEKLSQQVTALNNHPYTGWVTCNQLIVMAEGTLPPEHMRQELLQEHRSMVPSSWLVRAHVLAAHGGFDTALTAGEDTELILRWRQAGYQEANVDQLLLHKWQHSDNDSLNMSNMRKGLFEVLRKNTQQKKAEQH